MDALDILIRTLSTPVPIAPRATLLTAVWQDSDRGVVRSGDRPARFPGKEWWTVDARRAFDAALDHYRRGENLLNFPEAVPMEEQGLHFSRAAAHFAAGSLALALGHASEQLDDAVADGQASDPGPPPPQ
jgi:hypothetical protein